MSAKVKVLLKSQAKFDEVILKTKVAYFLYDTVYIRLSLIFGIA